MNLLGEDFTERAAEQREVLREEENLAAVDGAPAGDHTVGQRARVLDPEAVRAVAGQHVEFVERARVHEQVDAFTSRELAARVLALDRLGSPGVQRLLSPLGELRDVFLYRMRDGCGGFLSSHKAHTIRRRPGRLPSECLSDPLVTPARVR